MPFLSLGITTLISISWFGNLFAHGIFFSPLANIAPREWTPITYIEASKDYGFEEWDVYALFIFWLPPNFLPLVFYFLYKGLGNNVSEFDKQYRELGPLITGSHMVQQATWPKYSRNLVHRMRVRGL